MLLLLALIFLVGLSAAAIFEKIGLPRIIGMFGVPMCWICSAARFLGSLLNCDRSL